MITPERSEAGQVLEDGGVSHVIIPTFLPAPLPSYFVDRVTQSSLENISRSDYSNL